MVNETVSQSHGVKQDNTSSVNGFKKRSWHLKWPAKIYLGGKKNGIATEIKLLTESARHKELEFLLC